MKPSVPITERQYVLPLVLITSLFFMWALGVNLNDVLIPHLKDAFGLSDFKSSLIQTAFFGGYFLAALPAGWLMEKIGYKRGILLGLLTCAAGTILFVPAATVRLYAFFLLALFVMACGQAVLEVAANPYVTTLGPSESSERRLNLAQSFNAVGAVVTPIIGAAFILSGNNHAKTAAMSRAELATFHIAEANAVRMPYIVITLLFLSVAALVYFAQLPEIKEEGAEDEKYDEEHGVRGLLGHKHLLKGVVAQFFYVGAQVGVASFVIRFAQYNSPELAPKAAANYLKLHLLGFMIGRFAGSAVMKRVAAANLLAVFGMSSLVCLVIVLLGYGRSPIWALVLLGFFHSIMFPTIFALSIKHLGAYTKLGSSLLIMAIIGGALFPALMGYISDNSSIRYAFTVPLLCHIYVLYFSLRGYRQGLAAPEIRITRVGAVP